MANDDCIELAKFLHRLLDSLFGNLLVVSPKLANMLDYRNDIGAYLVSGQVTGEKLAPIREFVLELP